MADENTQVQDTSTEVEEVQQDSASTVLQSMVFGDAPIEAPAPTETSTAAAEPENQKEEYDEFDEATYIKNTFGYDDVETAKKEFEELKKLKETKPSFEYKNEESRKIAEYINEGKEDELYQFLDNKKKVEKLSKSDLTDERMAAELVKFGIKKDNPNLNDDDIDFVFNQKYSIPNKPVQNDLETDEEYAAKVQAWETHVQNVKRGMVIEAKIQQPKLAQLNTELVLPEIKRENQTVQHQPTQEDLAAFAKQRDDFLQIAKQSINGFNGFNVQVKDKDVDYTVGYTPSQEEKTIVENKVKQFAESGFDANAILAERWVAEDGKTLKVDQMIKDLSRIYADDKMAQKIASDSAAKRLDAYLKDKKKISFNQPEARGTFVPTKNANEDVSSKLAELVFG